MKCSEKDKRKVSHIWEPFASSRSRCHLVVWRLGTTRAWNPNSGPEIARQNVVG